MQIKEPKQIWQLSFEADWPTAIAFVDNRTIAAGNQAGKIFVWELPDAPPVATVEKDEKKKTKQSKDKENLLPDRAPTRLLNGHTNSITHLRTLPDNQTLVSSSLDHTIRVWDIKSAPKSKIEVVLDMKSREKRARYKPKDEKSKVLDAPGEKVAIIEAIHEFKEHKGWVNGLDVTPDGRRMISGDDQCRCIVWDVDKREPICSWKGYDRVWVRSAAISPDGKSVFSCEYAGRRSSFDVPAAQARIWNADDGSLRLDLLKLWTPKVKDKDRKDTYGYGREWGKLLKRGLVCASFSSDGKLLAVGQGGETDTGKVHLINLADGKILRTVSGHRYGVCDVKFSSDNKYTLSSGRDTTVRICRVADGKQIAELGTARGGQFKDWISAISISPDQKLVAGADIAGMVHVWQLSTV